MISYFVPGSPAPQGSKRHVGNGRMIESSKAVGPWRERVALASHAEMKGGAMLTGAVRVSLDFALPRPKSTPKTKTPPAVKRPDLDKLARAVLDAITGTILADDSQVVSLRCTKHISAIDETPGAFIEVWPVVG